MIEEAEPPPTKYDDEEDLIQLDEEIGDFE